MIIENSKTYTENEVENLFFRPSFCGKSAEELGIRVLYNMPTPTTVPTFKHNANILAEFASGWQGGKAATMTEVDIPLVRLKAENAYSASRYFNSVYDILVNSTDANLGDLTGTDLEKAETELFRRAIVESVYATMWFGDDQNEVSDFGSFTGFLRKILDIVEVHNKNSDIIISDEEEVLSAQEILCNTWKQANDSLKGIAADGQLVFFVSSDIYDAYHFYLEEKGVVSAVADSTNSRPALSFHGIPVVEIAPSRYNLYRANSFCILTDRRNLVLALNTADSPEKEIRMWYNPDEMQNRQRVVFLAGTAIIDPTLISAHIFDSGLLLS